MNNTIRRDPLEDAERELIAERHARLMSGRAYVEPSGSWRETFREVRAWLLLAALIAFSLVAFVPELSAAAPARAETVSGTFAPCGARIGGLCVVDGDTFRIGERRVRVVGIDTAERRAACEAERVAAAASTAALQNWLNRGPFEMTVNPSRAVDRYGRELQVVARARADGRVETLAEWMRAEGGAREYGGGARAGWC